MSEVIEFFSDRPVAAVILAGEVGFWVLLFGGLAVRYLLKRRRLSTVLLICVPLIDIVVLAATYLHLRSGAEPDFTHGLAAAYLGFSVVFGPSMLRWADQRFAHRFADGPPPWRPPRYGRAKVRHEWREFAKFVAAWAVAAAVIGLFVLAFGERATPMWGWVQRIGTIGVIWFVVGPLWTTLSPPGAPNGETAGHDRPDGSSERSSSEDPRSEVGR